jgi:hypothetical protein
MQFSYLQASPANSHKDTFSFTFRKACIRFVTRAFHASDECCSYAYRMKPMCRFVKCRLSAAKPGERLSQQCDNPLRSHKSATGCQRASIRRPIGRHRPEVSARCYTFLLWNPIPKAAHPLPATAFIVVRRYRHSDKSIAQRFPPLMASFLQCASLLVDCQQDPHLP